jgi:hypothetical protein
MTSNWKNTSAIIGITVTILAAGIAFAGKASKDEVDSIRRELYQAQIDHAKESTIQQHMLSLLEKMDARMGRMEDKQDRTLREVIGQRDTNGLPPSPNPLTK